GGRSWSGDRPRADRFVAPVAIVTTENAVRIRGVAASPGVAHGPWVRFERAAPVSAGRVAEPEAEVARMLAAAETVGKASERLAAEVTAAGHPDEAKVFLAHAMKAHDPDLLDAAAARIRVEGVDAISALALDGESGEVLVSPTRDDVARYETRAGAIARDRGRDLGEAAVPAITRDGVAVDLLANIGSPGEAAGAVSIGARGVGLFRTEFLFLERSTPPSEDEQVEAYGH